MNDLTLKWRIAVLVVAELLSVMGTSEAAAALADDSSLPTAPPAKKEVEMTSMFSMKKRLVAAMAMLTLAQALGVMLAAVDDFRALLAFQSACGRGLSRARACYVRS